MQGLSCETYLHCSRSADMIGSRTGPSQEDEMRAVKSRLDLVKTSWVGLDGIVAGESGGIVLATV
jgi:hypothetical protein